MYLEHRGAPGDFSRDRLSLGGSRGTRGAPARRRQRPPIRQGSRGPLSIQREGGLAPSSIVENILPRNEICVHSVCARDFSRASFGLGGLGLRKPHSRGPFKFLESRGAAIMLVRLLFFEGLYCAFYKVFVPISAKLCLDRYLPWYLGLDRMSSTVYSFDSGSFHYAGPDMSVVQQVQTDFIQYVVLPQMAVFLLVGLTGRRAGAFLGKIIKPLNKKFERIIRKNKGENKE